MTGCAKSSDTYVNPEAPGTSDDALTEPEEKLTAAYSLTHDGEHIAYISLSSETSNLSELEKELTEDIISAKRSELEDLGLEVKEIILENQPELTETLCKENELKTSDDATSLLLAREFKFTSKIIEKETKPIAFETVYQNSSSYYEGTKTVKTEGVNGEKELVFESIYENEVRVSRTQTSEKTLKKAQNKVVLVGTKKSTASTGKYIYPVKNVYITSYYGARTLNGKYDYHYGLDFRAANGTSILASDGGKVIYAGRMGTYGILIKIEHDNGNVTYYAHLSSVSVKVGDRVYQGQVIAKSGSTGNVTGPHLHFEIRVGGKHKNPLNYLKVATATAF